ncbi:hypothetical protein [Gluconobacter oxydans]|uniref:hypothetical protein n=1 Tax=Gluconobacter oxydans TaxID=442 RepID=UPI001CD8F239|nr:hypothetical protein [Gluconobacter oxydans]
MARARRFWGKLHIRIDDKLPEVRAVEITGDEVGDAPALAEISDDGTIASVTADKAYDTRQFQKPSPVVAPALPYRLAKCQSCRKIAIF